MSEAQDMSEDRGWKSPDSLGARLEREQRRELKQRKPCPHCGLLIVQTGEGRFPCSWCGRPLPSEEVAAYREP